eukprot:RCo027826
MPGNAPIQLVSSSPHASGPPQLSHRSAGRWLDPGVTASPRSTDEAKTRVPVKAVIIAALMAFTVGPAVVMWVVSWSVGSEGVRSVHALGAQSVEDATSQLQTSLMQSTTASFLAMVLPSKQIVSTMAATIRGTGMLQWDGATIGRNFSGAVMPQVYPMLFFPLMTSEYLSMFGYSVLSDTTYSFPDHQRVSNVQWITMSRLNINVITNALSSTLYSAVHRINPFYNGTDLNYYLLNQTSGQNLFSFYHVSSPSGLGTVYVDPSEKEYYQWSQDLWFNVNTGLPEIYLAYHVPFDDGLASHEVLAYTDVYIVSEFLQSMLGTPKERLALSFHNPTGTLIGASHGKTFSHSDIDFSEFNPLVNPPPVADFQRYTLVNSTDVTIQQAGSWLVKTYVSWEYFPDLTITVFLAGEDYWLANSVITSEYGLQLNLLLLIDRASRMAGIDANTVATLDSIARTNTRLTIVLAVVLVVAVGCAVGISLGLTRALQRLATGMDRLAVLQMEGLLDSTANVSRFREVCQCELSFISLKRGMGAFVRYVPRDVVRLMLQGEMSVDNHMDRR